MGALDDAFPGEAYLLEAPPNYAEEWGKIKAKLALIAFFVVVFVPVAVLPRLFSTTTADDGQEEEGTVEASAPVDAAKRRKQHAGKKRGKRKKPGPGEGAAAAPGKEKAPAAREATAETAAVVVAVPPLLMPALNALCLLAVLLVVARSPNNAYAAKRVFRAPLLTPGECDVVIEMARRAAERNYLEAVHAGGDGEFGTTEEAVEAEAGRRVVDEPRGWRKDRHAAHPTTDLNVVTDGFTGEDREWIRGRLDARLAPLIERVYGIPPGAIRANDMFVVRYDAHGGQSSLRRHRDSSHVSFNVLLNEGEERFARGTTVTRWVGELLERTKASGSRHRANIEPIISGGSLDLGTTQEFEGGGTRYHEKVEGGGTWDLKPRRGDVLLNNALVLHEGLAVASGTRYILVGFLNADAKDPLTGEPTGLGLFSSWLSAPWAYVRFKNGMEAARGRREDARRAADPNGLAPPRWTDNKYLISLFDDVRRAFSLMIDLWAPFAFTPLVGDERRAEYLGALDGAAEKRKAKGGSAPSASWFRGQQIDLDIDGSVARFWRTRTEAGEGKFADL